MPKNLFSKATGKRVKNAILAYHGFHASHEVETRATWARVVRDEREVFEAAGVPIADILFVAGIMDKGAGK
jgi:hypothetical protein